MMAASVDSTVLRNRDNSSSPLREENENLFEGRISKEECSKALTDMENRKSPGSDGFTSEFYKLFWKDIADDVVASINYAFDKGALSISQKRGIITLLPKKGNII